MGLLLIVMDEVQPEPNPSPLTALVVMVKHEEEWNKVKGDDGRIPQEILFLNSFIYVYVQKPFLAKSEPLLFWLPAISW